MHPQGKHRNAADDKYNNNNPFRVRSKSPELEIMPEPPKPQQKGGSAMMMMGGGEENKGRQQLKMCVPKGILKSNSDITNFSYNDTN